MASQDNPLKEKWLKGQRVFARDETSGILYEAVIRRTMFGVETNNKSRDEEEKPECHCFVHYLGWNVKWDRWVCEDSLYEMNDKTRALAQSLLQCVREAKKKHGSKSSQVMVELTQKMKQYEHQQRIEERRQELTKQGIILKEDDEAEEGSEPKPKQHTYTKAYFRKELSLRERNLQGRTKQALKEKLVLPFALKRILLDEWELITQCAMLPTLPATITVEQALEQYLASKTGGAASAKVSPMHEETHVSVPAKSSDLDDSGKPDAVPAQSIISEDTSGRISKESNFGPTTASSDSAAADLELSSNSAAEGEGTKASGADVEPEKGYSSNDESEKGQFREWKAMVDGITLLFDESLESRLLYRHEMPQLEVIRDNEGLGQRRYCQVYGCEHLLRLFLRIPALLADQLTDTESRPIFSKLNDLVRYLQKHQSLIFHQSYQAPSRKRLCDDMASKRRVKRSREAETEGKVNDKATETALRSKQSEVKTLVEELSLGNSGSI